MRNPNLEIPQRSTVLVTGATGFTGSVLIRKLAESGLKVRAIARPSSNVEPFRDLDIQWFRGDVFDPSIIREAAHDVSYVFHLAAVYREAKAGDEMNRLVHVESTKLLAQAVAGNPQFKRFVHLSTVGVHGHIENPPADENYPFAPGDVYQKTKTEAELWLREFAIKANLPFTVIRPAAIYGPDDRRLLKVFKMATWPVFPILGRGQCLYHLIHVEDLTDIIMQAAASPAALNEVFIGGNAEPVTLESMARTIAAELGRKVRVLRIPAWPFFLAGDLCETLCKPLGIEPPIYRRRVAFFTKDRAFNTSKLRERLNYTYTYTNEQGLIQTAQWYVNKGWL